MVARFLISVLLAVLSWPALAYYVDAIPPEGWRPPSAAAGGYATIVLKPSSQSSYGAPAMYLTPDSPNVHPIQASLDGDSWDKWLFHAFPASEAHAALPAVVLGGALVRTIVNVGGRAVVMPAMLRFAANAPRFGAAQGFRGAAVSIFGTLLLAAGIDWFWDETLKKWMKPSSDAVPSTGLMYSFRPPVYNEWYYSVKAACDGMGPPYESWWRSQDPSFVKLDGPYLSGSVCSVRYLSGSGGWQSWATVTSPNTKGSACPVGWYVTPAGCIQNPQPQQVGQEEFEQAVEPLRWPPELPEHLPDGVPVEQPRINPIPSPWDVPKPYYDPIGDPVRNPKFDPEKEVSPDNAPYEQPARRIIGSPTPESPWRTDVQPVNRPVIDPANPPGNVQPDPAKPPSDPASAPSPSGPSKPSGDIPALCELFPNISACALLGNPADSPDLQTQEKNVSVSPVGGFGPSSATCPEPVHISTSMGSWDLSYQPTCDLAMGVRPVVIALGWLVAAFLLVGGVRE